MNVVLGSEVREGDRGVLYVPAGRASAPRAVPAALDEDDGTPEGEVQQVLLLDRKLQRPQRELLRRHVRELPEIWEGRRVEVDGTVDHIRVPVPYEGGDFVHGLLHVVRDPFVLGDHVDFQAVRVLEEGLRVLLRQPHGVDSLLLCDLSDLVVNVGDVHEEVHLEPHVRQIPGHDVVERVGPGVTYVEVPLNRGPADEHRDFSGHPGTERLLLLGHRVV